MHAAPILAPGSWTQTALIVLCDLQLPWYEQAVADLRLLYPSMGFDIGEAAQGKSILVAMLESLWGEYT